MGVRQPATSAVSHDHDDARSDCPDVPLRTATLLSPFSAELVPSSSCRRVQAVGHGAQQDRSAAAVAVASRRGSAGPQLDQACGRRDAADRRLAEIVRLRLGPASASETTRSALTDVTPS